MLADQNPARERPFSELVIPGNPVNFLVAAASVIPFNKKSGPKAASNDC
jgi:hypothetical protein